MPKGLSEKEYEENTNRLSEIAEMLEGKTIKSVGSFKSHFPSVRIEFTDGTYLDMDFSAYNPMPAMVDEEYELEIKYNKIEGTVKYYPHR